MKLNFLFMKEKEKCGFWVRESVIRLEIRFEYGWTGFGSTRLK